MGAGVLGFLSRWLALHSALTSNSGGGGTVGTLTLLEGGRGAVYTSSPGWVDVGMVGGLVVQGEEMLRGLWATDLAELEQYLPQLVTMLLLPTATTPAWSGSVVGGGSLLFGGSALSSGPAGGGAVASGAAVARLRQGLMELILARCAENPALGVKLLWLVQDAFEDVRSMSARALIFQIYQTSMSTPARQAYFRDCMSFVQGLVDISSLLRRVLPRERRPAELERMLAVLNTKVQTRMATAGASMAWSPLAIDERALAARCPELADHSVHLVFAPGWTSALRVLRLSVEESAVMHSRSRVPYLVVMELLEKNSSRCDSLRLVTEAGVTPQVSAGGEEASTITPCWAVNDLSDIGSVGEELLKPGANDEWTKRAVFGEFWKEKCARLRQLSPFGGLEGWRLASFIVKAGDHLSQEQHAMQVLQLIQEIFAEEGLSEVLYLRPYSIICTGPECGLIETVADARSIDHVKKKTPNYLSLRNFFERLYGAPGGMPGAQGVDYNTVPQAAPGSPTVGTAPASLFDRAQENFAASLAAYSLVTYLLQVKDRHNANLLLDKDGHIIHIDFGYMLGQSPGGNINFESAPFKLTKEFADLLNGKGSPVWRQFEARFQAGFLALRRHEPRLTALLNAGVTNPIRRRRISEGIRSRLFFARTPQDILRLIELSYDNPRTKKYDWYQWKTNGILE